MPVHLIIGAPVSSFATVHVEAEVLTSTQPDRSLPLKRSTCACGALTASVFGVTAVFGVVVAKAIGEIAIASDAQSAVIDEGRGDEMQGAMCIRAR